MLATQVGLYIAMQDAACDDWLLNFIKITQQHTETPLSNPIMKLQFQHWQTWLIPIKHYIFNISDKLTH